MWLAWHEYRLGESNVYIATESSAFSDTCSHAWRGILQRFFGIRQVAPCFRCVPSWHEQHGSDTPWKALVVFFKGARCVARTVCHRNIFDKTSSVYPYGWRLFCSPYFLGTKLRPVTVCPTTLVKHTLKKYSKVFFRFFCQTSGGSKGLPLNRS